MSAARTIRRQNLSPAAAQAQKDKTVAFLRRVGKVDAANALADEPLDHYATRKGLLLENPRGAERRRNLFGFGGGGRKVMSADDVHDLQTEEADSLCRHHEYDHAKRVARQSPRKFAKSRGIQLEGAVTRAKKKLQGAAASKFSSWAKKLAANPDTPREKLGFYGNYARVPSAWYRLNLESLLALRRSLSDANFYHKESPAAARGRYDDDLRDLDAAIQEAERFNAIIYIAHDAAGWYFAREGEPRRGNPGDGIEFVIGRPKGKATTEVQSVLFDDRQWTPEEAKRWLRQNGFKTPPADRGGVGSHELRFRQSSPDDFQQTSFRTITAGRHRRNPDDGEGGELEQAAELFQSFQGRKPEEILEVRSEAIRRRDYAKLGDLVALTVVGPRRHEYKIDFAGGDDVMAVASANGRQIYFIGGNQDIRPMLGDLEVDATKDFVEVGPCVEIEYFTHKALDNFEPIRYFHRFGEESGDVPVLAFDQLNLQLLLVGGAYEIKPEGITN